MSAQPTELFARLIDLFGPQAAANPNSLYGNLTVLPSGVIQIGTGLTLPDGYTSVITPMGRNRVMNGDMRVQQRTSTAFATTAGYGGPDRWGASNSSGGGQFTQSAGTIVYGGVTYPAVVQTVNTAITTMTTTSYWYGFNQIIEGYNCYDLVGKPVTLSFLWNSNVSGTICATVRCGTTNNSCVQTFTSVANVPQIVTIVCPPIPTSVVIPASSVSGMQVTVGFLNNATYLTANTGVWQVGNFLTTTGYTNWGATAGNFISMTNVQLEAGASATPFEALNYADSLLRCMRYYEVSDGYSGYFWQGATTNANAENTVVKLWVPKRVAPTVVLSGGSLNSFGTPAVTGTPTALGFQVVATATATVANGYFQGGYTASADF